MNKRNIIIIGIMLVLVGILIAAVSGSNSPKNNAANETNQASETPAASGIEKPEHNQQSTEGCPSIDEITYNDDEFVPSCITIKSGATIHWRNTSTRVVEVGIDPHPAHTGNREISNNKFVLPIESGSSTTTSVITSRGTHKYHDHLNPQATGRIVVE